MNWIKATRPPISYRNHHLHRPDIDIVNPDDMRKSLSKLKEDFKHRIGGKKRASNKAGANVAEETASSSTSPRPDSRVTVGVRDEEGSKISTDASRANSRDPSPQPKSMQANEDRDDPQRRNVDVEEKEVGQRHSRPDPNVEAAAGSGPSQGVSSTLSVTPIAPEQGPDGTRTLSPQQLCLITLLDKADTAAVPNREQQDPRPEENAEPAAKEKKSSWKSTAFATAKLLLYGVKESADAFGPLKSVAGGLCFILENCEVWSSPACTITTLTGAPANEGERASDRVVGTSGQGTCRITSFIRFRRRRQGTREEEGPRTVSLRSQSSRIDSQMGIGRKLGDIDEDLALLGEQGKAKGFFNNVENADKLGGLVEDVRDAMMDYQVRIASYNLSFSPLNFL